MDLLVLLDYGLKYNIIVLTQENEHSVSPSNLEPTVYPTPAVCPTLCGLYLLSGEIGWGDTYRKEELFQIISFKCLIQQT